MFTTIITILVIVIGLLPLVGLFSLYNKLGRLRNQIENAVSSTDALFIKRSDLIPNLIATAERYADFEKDTLEKVTSMRKMNSKTPPEDEKEAMAALKHMMMQVERYPNLKSDQQFMNLQYNMSEVEEQISAGRRYISSSITMYNNAIISFPSNIVAKIAGFKKHEWQYATTEQRQNVNAKELFNTKK